MLIDAFLIGILAGLAIAMPLGAIGVLLIQEGVRRGWGPASAAATGVALVDLAYATLAVAAGTTVSTHLTEHSHEVRLGAAAILLGIAVKGLGQTIKEVLSSPGIRQLPRHHAVGDSVVPTDPRDAPGRGAAGSLLRFIALTAVNPMTAVGFVALTAGLGSEVSGAARGSVFVLGVFVASWGWQLCLATTGAFLAARATRRTQAATGLVGYLIVLWYAGKLAQP